MTFDVRRLQPEDHPRLRAIRLRALSREPDAYGSTFDREAAFTDDVWRQRLRPEGNAHFACCDDAGELVGLVAVTFDEEDVHVAELVSMWVDAEARGTGVADTLVNEAIRWASDHGCAAIRLQVTDGNSRAEGMYRRVGFERTGRSFTRERDGFPEIEMARRLIPG